MGQSHQNLKDEEKNKHKVQALLNVYKQKTTSIIIYSRSYVEFIYTLFWGTE